MLAVNFDNAGKLDDPEASKLFTERERYYAEPLRKKVPIIDFYGYFLFCCSSFSGMVHEFRDYYDFIEQRNYWSNIPRSKLIKPALKRFAQVPFWAAMMIVTALHYKKPYMLTEEFAASGFFYKAIYLIGACMVKLFMLVTGFSGMESNFIASGQGYKPERVTKARDGKEVIEKENFNSIKNIDIMPVFACTDFAALVNAWNI